MIAVSFTQADVGNPPTIAQAALADGGVYALIVGGVVAGGAGAGGTGFIRLSWTDAFGEPRQANTVFFGDSTIGQPSEVSLLSTVAYPSNISVGLVNQNLTGNFTVDAHVYIARVREEGND